MHIAYSAISTIAENLPSTNNQDEHDHSETVLRYIAYQNTCSKYSEEIASIQKYMPGWMPQFYSR